MGQRAKGGGKANLELPRLGDHAMVLEYKVGQDVSDLPALAEAGLRQIETKRYPTRAKAHEHVKKVFQICLAFSGKQVVMKHQEVTC